MYIVSKAINLLTVRLLKNMLIFAHNRVKNNKKDFEKKQKLLKFHQLVLETLLKIYRRAVYSLPGPETIPYANLFPENGNIQAYFLGLKRKWPHILIHRGLCTVRSIPL